MQLDRASSLVKETGVAEDDVRRVLRAIGSTGEAWQVAGTANVPFPQLIDVLQRLAAASLIQFQDSTLRLTPAGHELVRQLGLTPGPDHTCALCAGSGVTMDPFAEARERFMPIARERPPAISSFDQGALTVDSVFRRIALMDAQGDLRDRRLILIGDDDLTGLALALTGLPREIVVVEVDPRLCAFMEAAARVHGLRLAVHRHDLRQKLPPNLHGAFDTFITDPTETIQGLLLFVEKGLSMLAPGGDHAGYFGITLIEASLHKWNLWQRHLLQNHALAFTEITAPFSLYDKDPAGFERKSREADLHAPGLTPNPSEALVNGLLPFMQPAQRPWYRSSFFRIETLPEFVPPPDYDTNPRDELYQDAESMDEAWARMAGLEPQSTVPIPEEFLQASRERAAQAAYGLGRHIIAEFWNCQNETPLHGLDEAIERAVSEARATLLDLNVRRFYPQGFSAIALLAESHLSLHAWPELGYVALDVFTCGAADPQAIMATLERHFLPRDTAYLKIPRGRVR